MGKGQDTVEELRRASDQKNTDSDVHIASTFPKPNFVTHSLTSMMYLWEQQEGIFTTQGCPRKSKIYKHHILKTLIMGRLT